MLSFLFLALLIIHSSPSTPRPDPRRSHALRYVLRNRSTDETYLVIVFSLHLKEDVNEDGTLKPTAANGDREQLDAKSGKSEGEGANGGGDDDVD